MGLTREQKQLVISEVNAVAAESLSAIVADYKGLNAEELTALRSLARQNKIHLRVVRNTLAIRAVQGTPFECLSNVLLGPTILAFSSVDPGAPARLFKSFIKDHEKLKVKALSLGGRLIPAEKLGEVSSLPTYLEAVVTFLWVLNAPITKFVRTCAEPYAQIVRLMSAIGEKKRNQQG